MTGGSTMGRSGTTDDGFDTTDSRHNIRHREPPTDRAACGEAATSQSTHQDTPPDAFARDRGVWQVSWLAGPSPPTTFPERSVFQWHHGQALAAYSCGGSRGLHRVPF